MERPTPGSNDLPALLRSLKIIFFAMAVSIVLYWLLLEIVLVPNRQPPEGPFRNVLIVLGLVTAGAVLYMRFKLIDEQLAPADPSNAAARFGKLRNYFLLCYVLTEAIALWGFVLRFMGAPRSDAVPFFVGAFGLLALCYPRLPADPSGE